MSMLSVQCDELRAMAESVGLAMPQAATLMMKAADTIWELRCKLADMVDMRERARVAEAENAKLRDENSMLRKYAFTALSAISYCDCCPYVDCCDTETVSMHEGCKAFEELRELGIEVE